jgi:hypothetical protein
MLKMNKRRLALGALFLIYTLFLIGAYVQIDDLRGTVDDLQGTVD